MFNQALFKLIDLGFYIHLLVMEDHTQYIMARRPINALWRETAGLVYKYADCFGIIHTTSLKYYGEDRNPRQGRTLSRMPVARGFRPLSLHIIPYFRLGCQAESEDLAHF